MSGESSIVPMPTSPSAAGLQYVRRARSSMTIIASLMLATASSAHVALLGLPSPIGRIIPLTLLRTRTEQAAPSEHRVRDDQSHRRKPPDKSDTQRVLIRRRVRREDAPG